MSHLHPWKTGSPRSPDTTFNSNRGHAALRQLTRLASERAAGKALAPLAVRVGPSGSMISVSDAPEAMEVMLRPPEVLLGGSPLPWPARPKFLAGTGRGMSSPAVFSLRTTGNLVSPCRSVVWPAEIFSQQISWTLLSFTRHFKQPRNPCITTETAAVY